MATIRVVQIAWELYQEDTRGLTLAAGRWDELGKDTQQEYLDKAEKMLTRQSKPQGRCAGPYKNMGLFNEDCIAIDCEGFWLISNMYAKECGNCRRWRREKR